MGQNTGKNIPLGEEGCTCATPSIQSGSQTCPSTRYSCRHSVRAVYMYTAMADIAYETKDKELAEACTRIWTDITQRQMYITGGIGATYHGEAFTLTMIFPTILFMQRLAPR